MNIIIIGRGSMAKAMELECKRREINCVMLSRKFLEYTPEDIDFRESVVINFGGKGSIDDTVRLCLQNNIPLIHGSSAKEDWPEGLMVMEAVNLSIPTIHFLRSVIDFGRKVKNFETTTTIIESHQAQKKDVSATAIRLTEALGISRESVCSIRHPSLQKTIGIPDQFIDGHAYHDINMSFGDVEVSFRVKVLGRKTYTDGVLFFAKLILGNKNKLERRVYNAEEILGLTQ